MRLMVQANPVGLVGVGSLKNAIWTLSDAEQRLKSQEARTILKLQELPALLTPWPWTPALRIEEIYPRDYTTAADT